MPMASSPRKWASIVSAIASSIFFLLVIFQMPFFRVPCGYGICTTPILVTASQMFASELFPEFVIKALLYPGACASSILKNSTIPSFDDNILKLYRFTTADSSAISGLRRIEVLAGSYLCVAGAILGVIRAGRMSLFGVLLILFGLATEAIFGKPGGIISRETIFIYPINMPFVLICAFLSVRRDVRKVIRCCQARHGASIKELKEDKHS